MDQSERLSEIMTLLENQPQVTADEICNRFNVSKDTARRDIVELEKAGVVERFRGGVRQPVLKKQVISYQERLIAQAAAKRSIADRAAKLITENNVIMLDVSTTVQFIADFIQARNILAVTHSLDNVDGLLKNPNTEIYILGGYFHKKSHLLYGPSVMDKIRNFHFDIAFIGASAIDPGGIHYPDEEDIFLKKAIITASQKVVLLADHTKFSGTSVFRLDFSGIDTVITDRKIPKNYDDILKAHDIQVIISGENDG